MPPLNRLSALFLSLLLQTSGLADGVYAGFTKPAIPAAGVFEQEAMASRPLLLGHALFLKGRRTIRAWLFRQRPSTDPHRNERTLTWYGLPPLRGELLPTPFSFGSYRVERTIGAGGMGILYLAESPEKKQVAIKVPRNAHLVHQFIREAGTLLRLQEHLRNPSERAYFLEIYEINATTPEQPFVVMEYSPYPTLKEFWAGYLRLLKPRARLIEALAITKELLKAIGVAHRLGIIHRDLKPENILIDKTPHGYRIKLIDFGISARWSVGRNPVQHVEGSLNYMSPEQYTMEHAGPRSDLYSIGLIFYELATGRRALDRKDPLRGQQEDFRKRLQESTFFPPALARVLLRVTETDPNRRYASAYQLDVALSQASGGNQAMFSFKAFRQALRKIFVFQAFPLALMSEGRINLVAAA